MIRTKYELIRRNENVSVEMDAEFEEDITHKFYNHHEIYSFTRDINLPILLTIFVTRIIVKLGVILNTICTF